MKLTHSLIPDYLPERFGPAVCSLLQVEQASPLGVGMANRHTESALRKFDPLTDLGVKVTNANAAQCGHAGLWLLHNFWEEAHTICQDIATPEGSFWHAILHRREPDAWNSKYWFRQIGQHVVLDQLVQISAKVGYQYSSPAQFVDYCELHRGKSSHEEEIAIQVQLLEWQLLFNHCWQLATG
jgi:hypothetical protein